VLEASSVGASFVFVTLIIQVALKTVYSIFSTCVTVQHNPSDLIPPDSQSLAADGPQRLLHGAYVGRKLPLEAPEISSFGAIFVFVTPINQKLLMTLNLMVSACVTVHQCVEPDASESDAPSINYLLLLLLTRDRSPPPATAALPAAAREKSERGSRV
jgi:hypothetical protein